MGDEFLFQPFKMEIFAVAQKLLAMFFVPDVNRITAEEMKKLGKYVGGAVGHLRRKN